MNIPTTAPLISWDLQGKRVLVRADLNVPLDCESILDDYKLRSVEPTISYILRNGGSILLVTHIGKQAGTHKEPSTVCIVKWLQKHGYAAVHAPTLEDARTALEQHETITVLENIRRWKEEKTLDTNFAQKLRSLADFYVNDAFGSLHRKETSSSLLPLLFESKLRSIGFLVEKELSTLVMVRNNPARPFVAILGGNKFSKLEIIPQLLSRVDTLLLCPALSNAFLPESQRAESYRSCSAIVQHIRDYARSHAKTIEVPIDYQIKINATYCKAQAQEIQQTTGIISIGEQTASHYTHFIHQAKTVLYNGLSGFMNIPETLSGTKKLFQAMSESSGVSIIAGGDSSAAALALEFEDKVSLLSTGGGATLAFISGQELPGLEPFMHS